MERIHLFWLDVLLTGHEDGLLAPEEELTRGELFPGSIVASKKHAAVRGSKNNLKE